MSDLTQRRARGGLAKKGRGLPGGFVTLRHSFHHFFDLDNKHLSSFISRPGHRKWRANMLINILVLAHRQYEHTVDVMRMH